MGGDLFLFASVKARSMSFHWFHTLAITQHMFTFSAKPLGIISTPNRRFRPKSISCSNNDSSSVNFSLVSASECSDGSVLFRFGDKSETERNLKVEESPAKPTHGGMDKNSAEKQRNDNEVLYHSKSGQRNEPDQDNFISVKKQLTCNDSEVVEAHGESSERSRDISASGPGFGTNLYSEEDSSEKACGEVLSSVTVSEIDDGVEVESSSAFKGNSERNDKNEVSTVSVESKLGLVSDVDKVCASLEFSNDTGSGEITTQFPSSGSELKDKSPNRYASHKSSEETEGQSQSQSQNVEVMQVSTVAKEHNVDMVPNYVTGEAGADGNVIDVMFKSADAILDNGTTHSTVEESVDTHRIVISKMEDEITEDDTLIGDTIEVSVSDAMEFQSVRPTSKREEISTTEFFLSSGAVLLQHPSKALTGGGDAYFVACQNWLGIADGVGQWSLEGINAGLYAQELMENCEKIVSESKSIPVTDPVEVLTRSAVKTQSPGSATVLVAYFDGEALHVANIGDSGFLIIRHGTVFKRSSPMVHEFNFPIQIEKGYDPAERVEVYKIDLIEGDVIVTSTDGLFDNLFEQEIAVIVSRSLQDGFKTQEIAESLATRAQKVGQSGSARSPFADAAQAAGYVGYNGGKLDDVTVIVSLVEKRSISHL